MEIIANVLKFLDARMPDPAVFGWFHIMWIGLLGVGIFLFCKFIKGTEKNAFNVVLITTVLSILLEIYKQINYTFQVSDGVITTHYQWYAFPFQFCATPMYVGLLYCIFAKTRARDYFAAFLATFSIFGGLVVYIYPEQVFIDIIGINIQTMVYHGFMIIVGVWLLYTKFVPLKSKTILKAAPVFVGCLTVAIILNELAVATNFTNGETFNMFYVSPHFEGTLPIYCEVQKVVPYPWSLIIYIVGFTAAAYIILAVAMLINKLFGKKNKSAKETVNV